MVSVPFSPVAQSCPTFCDPMNRSTPGLPVHHQLPESTQTHVHWVGDAIPPSHPLSYGSRWEWAHCHFCHTQFLRQGGLQCCSPWGRQELDTTGWPNNSKCFWDLLSLTQKWASAWALEHSLIHRFGGQPYEKGGDPEDISICIQTLKVLVELMTPKTNPGSYHHLFLTSLHAWQCSNILEDGR